jgi:hypothetical protein
VALSRSIRTKVDDAVEALWVARYNRAKGAPAHCPVTKKSGFGPALAAVLKSPKLRARLDCIEGVEEIAGLARFVWRDAPPSMFTLANEPGFLDRLQEEMAKGPLHVTRIGAETLSQIAERLRPPGAPF